MKNWTAEQMLDQIKRMAIEEDQKAFEWFKYEQKATFAPDRRMYNEMWTDHANRRDTLLQLIDKFEDGNHVVFHNEVTTL